MNCWGKKLSCNHVRVPKYHIPMLFNDGQTCNYSTSGKPRDEGKTHFCLRHRNWCDDVILQLNRCQRWVRLATTEGYGIDVIGLKASSLASPSVNHRESSSAQCESRVTIVQNMIAKCDWRSRAHRDQTTGERTWLMVDCLNGSHLGSNILGFVSHC